LTLDVKKSDGFIPSSSAQIPMFICSNETPNVMTVGVEKYGLRLVNPRKKCLELIVAKTYASVHDSLYKTGVSR
jgi:hypothetical protein